MRHNMTGIPRRSLGGSRERQATPGPRQGAASKHRKLQALAYIVLACVCAATALPTVLHASPVSPLPWVQPYGLCQKEVPDPAKNTAETVETACPVAVIGRPKAVTLTAYRRAGGRPLAKSLRIAKQAKVDDIVALLDHHLRWYPLSIFCPTYRGIIVVLRFSYSNGDRWTVNVDTGGCTSVITHQFLARADAALTDYLVTLTGVQVVVPTPSTAPTSLASRSR
jgi:hypothetical protein